MHPSCPPIAFSLHRHAARLFAAAYLPSTKESQLQLMNSRFANAAVGSRPVGGAAAAVATAAAAGSAVASAKERQGVVVGSLEEVLSLLKLLLGVD